MNDKYADNFGPFGNVAWINASHQGAIPKTAVVAAQEAIEWKRSPHPLINSQLFYEVPKQQREVLGKLINCSPEDIILSNSASYGLHLLANGICWKEGDEVLVVKSDFPATIFPWLGLADRGVSVRAIELSSDGLDPDLLERSITERTKVFCTSWVSSFSGIKIDLSSVSEICGSRGVRLVLNCSQGVGSIPFDLNRHCVDALTCCGFKWLCGPYGTGFCWIVPELRESLKYNQAYWLAMQTVDNLKETQGMPQIRDNLGGRKYDVFGTANFFNLKPWTAAVNLLLDIGVENVWAYDQSLIQRLIDGLDANSFEFISPTQSNLRSNILIVSHRDSARNERLAGALQDEDIYISLRNGRLRFSPHVYNTADHIDRALSILNAG